MSTPITIQQPGDVVWTMPAGRLRAWIVQEDGTLTEADAAVTVDQLDARAASDVRAARAVVAAVTAAGEEPTAEERATAARPLPGEPRP